MTSIPIAGVNTSGLYMQTHNTITLKILATMRFFNKMYAREIIDNIILN